MDGIKRRIILALISVRVENRADRSDSRNNSSSSGIKLEPKRTTSHDQNAAVRQF